MTKTILLVDDDRNIGLMMRQIVMQLGVNFHHVMSIKEARIALAQQKWSLMILDYQLGDGNGIELIQSLPPDQLPVFMFVTGYGSTDLGVKAMQLGAIDFLEKPFQPNVMRLKVEIALRLQEVENELKQVHQKRDSFYSFDQVRFKSKAMEDVFELAKTYSATESNTLLITGESGVGKSFLAELIHYNSQRRASPFIHVTCTTLSAELLESELFGHEKGAFTDARATKVGLAEVAHGGTLFLDEIGDMSQSTQAKLLGLLDTSRFRRVGGMKEIEVNVRFVAATNRDLETMVQEKTFRSDLFYRLNVVQFKLPNLRERTEDIPVLADMFAARIAHKLNRKVITFRDSAVARLKEYPWPGNLRELSNVIERCLIFNQSDFIDKNELDRWLAPVTQPSNFSDLNIESTKQRMVEEALRRTAGNQTKAAKLLGLTRAQLTYALKREDE